MNGLADDGLKPKGDSYDRGEKKGAGSNRLHYKITDTDSPINMHKPLNAPQIAASP
ncbi:hypothetical protein C8E01_11136 [Pontibacter virosus]|uniref:Uncharacterized protein n=1 Tax=Pontibacter virosus TaxID=1765052 RepID=A0A2U1ASM4_9BACT|nr:hypothetical protein C8E01_11136 [Pontibacter virosus]